VQGTGREDVEKNNDLMWFRVGFMSWNWITSVLWIGALLAPRHCTASMITAPSSLHLYHCIFITACSLHLHDYTLMTAHDCWYSDKYMHGYSAGKMTSSDLMSTVIESVMMSPVMRIVLSIVQDDDDYSVE
jgi:hypothetical protein